MERKRLQTLAAHAQAGLWDWDLITNEIHWDEQNHLLYGLDSMADTKMDKFQAWHDFVHPNDLQRVQKEIYLAINELKPYKVQYRVVLPDGVIRHFESIGTVVRDEKEIPMRMLGMTCDITENFHRMEQMRLSSMVIANTNDAVIITEAEPVDPPGPRVIFVNDAFEHDTGYSREEIIGKTPRILQGPESDRVTLDRIRQALKSWKPIQVELLNYKKNGEAYWVDMSIKPVADETGWYTHWIAIQRDVTLRKQQEHLQQAERRNLQQAEIEKIQTALKLEKARLLLANKNASAGLWEWDIQEDHLVWDDRMYELYRVAHDEFPRVYDGWISRVHPADRERVERVMQMAIQGESIYSCQFRLMLPDSSIRHIQAEGTLIRDSENKPKIMIGVNIDLTASITMQEEMRLSSLVIANTNDVVIITEAEPVDRPGPRIVFVNDAFEQVTGYSRQEVIGRHPRFLQGPETDRAALYRIREALQKRQPCKEEILNYKKNGDPFWFDVNYAPVTDETGRHTHWISIQRDITERKLASEKRAQIAREVEAARAQAQQASEAKSRFLATMSHELRTPMNGILGMSQVLSMQGGMSPDQQECVDVILESGDMMTRVLDDILDFSSIEAGSLRLVNAPFSPEEVIKETLDLYRLLAESKGLELAVNFEDLSGLRYFGDKHRLRQMMSNLLGNAIKFTPRGSIQLSVQEILRMPEAVVVQFAVSDTGLGIPHDQQQHVFKPFTQVDDSTTRKFGGTGLGLAVVHELAILMGGHVDVSSSPGKGSRFSFSIPLKVVEEPKSPVAHENQSVQPFLQQQEADTRLRILVVEDVAINLRVIRTLLSQLGYACDYVEDGAACVDAIRNGMRPALILMDIHMPVMNGLVATQLIRQWEYETARAPIPIVAMTGAVFDQDIEDCQIAGMDGFLKKPLSLAALIPVLQKWCGGLMAES